MNVCKNVKSCQYFIYISEASLDEVLLVTPGAEIKSLNNNLFSDPEEISEEHLLGRGLVTRAQIWKYKEHKEFRARDVNDDLDLYFENLSPSGQMSFLKRIEKLFGEM